MSGKPFEVTSQRYEAAVPLTALTPHPMNPNEGDVGLLAELLDANGFVGAVLAQDTTGIIIDGETRWRAASATGAQHIPVMWVQVDDETRDRLLASINESNRRGRNDESKLLALLQPFAGTLKGFAGTAFDGDDVDRLLAGLGKGLSFGPSPEADGGYAEGDEELADRADKIDGYKDRSGGGALIEMILVFTPEARQEVDEHVTTARRALEDANVRAADIVLRALRVLAQVLNDGATADMAARVHDTATQKWPQGSSSAD